MEEHGIGCVLVSDDQSPIVGILSDRDLVCRLVARESASKNPVMVDRFSKIRSRKGQLNEEFRLLFSATHDLDQQEAA